MKNLVQVVSRVQSLPRLAQSMSKQTASSRLGLHSALVSEPTKVPVTSYGGHGQNIYTEPGQQFFLIFLLCLCVIHKWRYHLNLSYIIGQFQPSQSLVHLSMGIPLLNELLHGSWSGKFRFFMVDKKFSTHENYGSTVVHTWRLPQCHYQLYISGYKIQQFSNLAGINLAIL